MDSHAPAPTPKKNAPYLFAVASPSTDLGQFAREALWMANERDLELTLAVREIPRWRAKLSGLETAENVTEFAKRWNINLVPWRSGADLDALVHGWDARRPSRVLVGPRGLLGVRPGLPPSLHGKLVNTARSQGIDVSVDASSASSRRPVLGLTWRTDENSPWYHAYVLSAFAVSLVALLVNWLDGILPAESLSVTFLMAVVYSAAAYGMAAAMFTVALSLGIFNYFFTAPKFSLEVSGPEDVLPIIIFLLIAGITSNLSGNLRRQAQRAKRQAQEARALFQLTRDMAIAEDTEAIFRAIVQQCNDVFDCDAVLLTPFTGGGQSALTLASVQARTAALQTAYPPNASLTQDEIEAARWSYSNGEAAGLGAAQFADMGLVLQPMRTSEGTVAVLALKGIAPEVVRRAGFSRLIGSICRLAAIAVERTLRKLEVESARVVSQTEGLRSALLSAISHDFGTPLASIIGSASSLLSFGATYSPEVTHDLLETIMEEAERLNRFVKNVLQMTRLESGALVPRLQWADVEDLISTSLDAAHRRLNDFEIYADITDKLPMVSVDFVLMESVLVNILDNAAKYAPEGTPIQITARRMGEDVTIDVTDQGRGIASEDLGAVFDKFYRARARDRTVAGTGLGLAICKGIVEAHGGSVEALSEGLGRGTTVRIRLPVKTVTETEFADV